MCAQIGDSCHGVVYWKPSDITYSGSESASREVANDYTIAGSSPQTIDEFLSGAEAPAKEDLFHLDYMQLSAAVSENPRLILTGLSLSPTPPHRPRRTTWLCRRKSGRKDPGRTRSYSTAPVATAPPVSSPGRLHAAGNLRHPHRRHDRQTLEPAALLLPAAPAGQDAIGYPGHRFLGGTVSLPDGHSRGCGGQACG